MQYILFLQHIINNKYEAELGGPLVAAGPYAAAQSAYSKKRLCSSVGDVLCIVHNQFSLVIVSVNTLLP